MVGSDPESNGASEDWYASANNIVSGAQKDWSAKSLRALEKYRDDILNIRL